MRAPGCRWRTMPSSARPCRLTSATSCSDQPSRARRQAEGRGVRQAERLGGRNRAQQQIADAVVERIAARQHHDRPAAMLLDLRQRRRRSGSARRACGRGSGRSARREMALATDDKLGRGDQLLRHRREAFDAVLADADDGQPARAPCRLRARSSSADPAMRVLILGGTTEASALARLLAGDRALRGDAVAGRPHLRAQAAAAGHARRRLRRRRRVSPTISANAEIEAVIDATHPYADRISGQCRGRLQAAPACRSPRSCGRRGRRSQAIAGRSCRRPKPRPMRWARRRDACS